MEPRSDDRGQRAEVHYVTSNTILCQFEAAKQSKIACRAVQKPYGPLSEGVQKLYAPRPASAIRVIKWTLHVAYVMSQLNVGLQCYSHRKVREG